MFEKLRDRDWLDQKYTIEGLSCAKIRDIVGCKNRSSVLDWLVKHGIPRRSRPNAIDWLSLTEKKCTRCGLTKPIEEFGLKDKETGQRQSMCRACGALYNREWYERNAEKHKKKVYQHNIKQRIKHHEYLYEYLLEHPCVDCGEVDPIVLEFDHVRGKKLYGVTLMVGISRKKVDAEIAKCEVRCANCHKRRTYKGTFRDVHVPEAQ